MYQTRREFIHDSAAIAAAVAAAGLGNSQLHAEEPAAAKKGQVNDRLNVAVIGLGSPPDRGGRGRSHVSGFAGKNNCVITTLCDVDDAPTVISDPMKSVEKAQGKTPKFEKDLRRVLDDKSIDIISIATPNHWHALAAIWALQAGKHVYVEKPVSHNVSEGRRIVEAARKYNKLCQCGTQSRSNPGMRESIAYLESGKLGKIYLARGLCYKDRKSIGKVEAATTPPKTIDYDLWCGPAKVLPVMRTKLHYDWHWTWEYGNGDLGNQGIHEMDKARWGLGRMELPKSVVSVGGRFGYIDDGQTANTQVCVFDYGDAQLTFEVRGLKSDKLKNVGVGNIFYGEKGILVCPNYMSGVVFDLEGKQLAKFEGGGDQHHFDNFVKAVRSGKREDQNAEILDGHLSSALCHLGNISYRLGSEQAFSAKAEAFGDNKDALEAFGRMQAHLKENAVPLEGTKYRAGIKLAIDPKTETFIGNAQANAMLTREYRKGFEVPKSF